MTCNPVMARRKQTVDSRRITCYFVRSKRSGYRTALDAKENDNHMSSIFSGHSPSPKPNMYDVSESLPPTNPTPRPYLRVKGKR